MRHHRVALFCALTETTWQTILFATKCSSAVVTKQSVLFFYYQGHYFFVNRKNKGLILVYKVLYHFYMSGAHRSAGGLFLFLYA